MLRAFETLALLLATVQQQLLLKRYTIATTTGCGPRHWHRLARYWHRCEGVAPGIVPCATRPTATATATGAASACLNLRNEHDVEPARVTLY
jgi:hypothetical protein